jgi:hypothetical protein
MMSKLIEAYYEARKIVNISKLSLLDQCMLLAFHSITTKENFSRVIRPTEKDIYTTTKIVRLKKLEILLVSCRHCNFINKLHCK